MATDLTGVQAAPTAEQAPELKPAERRPHRLRFMLLYGILAGVLGAAIAGVALLAGTGSSSSKTSSAWSTWQPAKSGSAAVSEIASHVSKAYRLKQGGPQLLDVIAKPPAVQNILIKAVAVRNKSGNADEVSLFDDTNSLMFVLCGGGTACSIATGKPTIARGTLVRREALELALYTFKYVGNVKYIVAFIPPKKGATPLYAVYFHRSDFSQELQRPLADTLALKAPAQNAIPARETTTIDRLTAPHTFKFTLQQTQQGDAILLLDPAV
jgi:hypothetical protein